jgi:Calcium-dependent channel, 7TM region, putative phosphate
MIIATYSWVSPLLMPMGALFYSFSYLMYKYQLLYVYINKDQSGGFMWYDILAECSSSRRLYCCYCSDVLCAILLW